MISATSRASSAVTEMLLKDSASSQSVSGGFAQALAEAIEHSLSELGIAADQLQVSTRAGEPGALLFEIRVRPNPQPARPASAGPARAAEASPRSIPPYDPKVGPQITPEMYTEEMLTEPFDAAFLRNVKDPAGFMEARLARLLRPTSAVVRGPAGLAPQPLNPGYLSTLEQAKTVLERLRKLRIDAGEITDGSFSEGPFWIDYAGDERRAYYIGSINVGALLRLYATYPVEVADQMVLDEWRRSAS